MLAYYLDLSWRSIKRTPLVSALMILAIAVGIGVTMTSLSVYHMMSMDPSPQKSSKLFYPQINPMDEGTSWRTSDGLPHQLTYQDAMNIFQSTIPSQSVIGMRTGFTFHLNSPDLKPFMELVRATNSAFFDMFNMTFIYGSAWTAEQAQNGAPVIVISESLNEKLFGGESSLGQTVHLDSRTYTIVGVVKDWDIPIKYYDLTNGDFEKGERAFIPFSLVSKFEIDTWGNTNGWRNEPGNTFQDKLKSELFWIQLWVRLDSPSQRQDFESFLVSYMQEQQGIGRFKRKSLDFALRDLNEWLDYNRVVSEDNKVLVGLSFMFLAVCVANILGLLLAKFLRRAPDIGVRRALGASKFQVFYQHIVEVSVMGLIGGLLGIMLANIGLWSVRQVMHNYQSLAVMDLSMLLSAPAIAIAACILAGLYPAWLVCRTAPATYLKSQ